VRITDEQIREFYRNDDLWPELEPGPELSQSVMDVIKSLPDNREPARRLSSNTPV
jgi:hypothetical protein